MSVDCLLVDGTFWTDDEMIRLGLGEARRDMGHLPQSGPGGMIEVLERLRRTAQDAHPHQQHQPDPRRGLARARARLRRAGIEVAHDGMEIDL